MQWFYLIIFCIVVRTRINIYYISKNKRRISSKILSLVALELSLIHISLNFVKNIVNKMYPAKLNGFVLDSDW